MIFNIEFKNKQKSLITWTLCLSILVIAMVSLIPAMETDNMKSLVNAKLEGIPEGVLAAFGISEMPDFANPSVFYAYVYQYINIALAIFAGLMAGNTLVEEESNGTMEYLYGQPISRSRIFIEKTLTTAYILLILSIIVNIAGMVSVNIFKSVGYSTKEINRNIIKMLIGTLFINFIFLSIGIFLSSISKNTKSITGMTMGLVFGTYIIGIVGDIVEKYVFLNKLSPLNIMNPMNLIDNMPSFKLIIPWLIVSIIFIILGYINYQSKDFNI